MISFVYFDVGGVVIKDFSDTDKYETMMHTMGLDAFDSAAVDQITNAHDDAICRGTFETDDLIPLYEQEFGITIPSEFSMLQYFVDHFEANPSIFPIISKIKQTTRVGLLTDMYPRMFTKISERHLFPPVYWDTIIDSTEVGLRKPMPEIYELAEKRAGVPAEQILFIDNREKNLVPARHRGWQTFLYDSKNYETASRDLSKFLSL